MAPAPALRVTLIARASIAATLLHALAHLVAPLFGVACPF